jgi:hypothetical protein
LRSFCSKTSDFSLATLGTYFDRYLEAVNLALQRIYSNPTRAIRLGKQLCGSSGFGYNLLRKERDLSYQNNEDFRHLVFERLHRNVLEQASRIVQGDYTRRALVESALSLLYASPVDQIRLLKNRYIPADLIRRVKDLCEGAKNNGTAYYYALAALKQVRKALDEHVLASLGQPLSLRPKQRERISEYLQKGSRECDRVTSMVADRLSSWKSTGFSFTIPQMKKPSLDYSGSTGNSLGQGYWFELDSEKQDEIFLHIKLPASIDGVCTSDSPYGSHTLTLRFLDWLPRAAAEARAGAQKAKQEERIPPAIQLGFRAAKLEDQHQQLMNTIRIQHSAHSLSRARQRKKPDEEEIARLQGEMTTLKFSRRSAPPRVLVRGHRVTLQIPFLVPDKKSAQEVLQRWQYTRKAGVDRGIRVPVTLSVQEADNYIDELLRVEGLLEKRARLRRHASALRSEVDRGKNNWARKRPGLSHPGSLLKKERHQDAVWQKVCRLDREMVRLVAWRTVWFCEEHNVKTVYFEDLRNYQPPCARGDSSWKLSSNLWGKIIDTVRYMRESLGHSVYGVWTVNPGGTSQTCHVCRKKGIRVASPGSEVEKKGGEYFYCAHCKSHINADINAARNIIQVQTSSVVPGRTNTECPTYNERHRNMT